MNKLFLIVSTLISVGFVSLNVEAQKNSIKYKLTPDNQEVKQQPNGFITRSAYYEINAGDRNYYIAKKVMFARYVFKLEYQINPKTRQLIVNLFVPPVENLAKNNQNPGPNESFWPDKHPLKITDYSATINMNGTADIKIKWSYKGEYLGSGVSPDGDSGTSIIRVALVRPAGWMGDWMGDGSWVLETGGQWYVDSAHSGLRKIGPTL